MCALGRVVASGSVCFVLACGSYQSKDGSAPSNEETPSGVAGTSSATDQDAGETEGDTERGTGGAGQASMTAGDSAQTSDGCLVTADRDGDGVSRTLDECLGDAGAHALPKRGDEDCDDADPTKSRGRQYYTDSDADGYGAKFMQSAWGCGGDVIDGFAPNVDDCDDGDANLHRFRFVDADGDGEGSGEPVCVNDDEPGFALHDSDCDDSDAAINRGAEGELPLDEIDTDCDGEDFPVLSVGGAEGPLQAIPEPSRCSGVALSLVAVELIIDCGGGFNLQIANRGDEAAVGGQVLVEESTGYVQEIALPDIGPGQILRRAAGGGGLHAVTLVTPSNNGDCAPMSTSAAVQAPFVDCIR